MSLDDLRTAYRDLQPPAVGDDLRQEPADVQRVVRALRREWRAIPTAGLDTAGFLRRTLRRRRWRQLRAAAVAALVLCAVLYGVLYGVLSTHVTPTRVQVEDIVQSDTTPTPRAAAAQPQVLIATRERIEMRAGVVRLVLVQPTPPDRDHRVPRQERPRP